MKRKLSILLAMVMLLTMIPMTNVAADSEHLTGTEKAKIELVYMKYKDGVTEGLRGLTGATAGQIACEETSIDQLNVGDSFLVGVKISNLDNIKTVADGNKLNKATIAIGYDTDYLTAEDGVGATSDQQARLRKYLAGRNGQGTEEVGGTGLFGYGKSNSALNRYEVDAGETAITVQGGTEPVVKLAFNYKGEEMPPYPNSTEYDDAQIIGIAKFTVKAVPTNGGRAVYLAEAEGASSITFGSNSGTLTGYNLGTRDNNMTEIFDFDSSKVNIFPAGVTALKGTVSYNKDTNAVVYGDEVTASWTPAADNSATVTWKWNTAAGDTAEKAKMGKNDVGKSVYATATATDTTAFTGEVSGAAITVGKATLDVSTVPAITLDSKKAGETATGTIIVKGVDNEDVTVNYSYKYPNDATPEQELNNVDVTLAFNSNNNFKNYYTLSATTVKGNGKVAALDEMAGTASIEGTAQYGQTLIAKYSANNEGTLSYSWKIDGTEVGTAATYKIKATDVGETITLTVKAANASGEKTATTSEITAKKLTVTGPITVQPGNNGATVTGNVLTDNISGIVAGDSVTVTYSYTYPDGDNDEGTLITNVKATIATTTPGYTVDTEVTATGTIQKAAVTGITITKQPDKTSYTYPEKISLAGLEVEVTYEGGIKKTFAYDALPGGATFTIGGENADGAVAKYAMNNSKITVEYGNQTPVETTEIHVAKAATTLAFVTADLAQKVGSTKVPGVTVTPDDDGTVTVEVKTKDAVPAVDPVACTCSAISEPDLDAATHDEGCPYTKGSPAVDEEWTEITDANVRSIMNEEKTYDVRATYADGTNTEDVPTPITGQVVVSKASGGGGGGSSMLTVRFDAGVNGKITKGSSTVKVAKNEKLKSSDIPTVTANEGYRFLGWTLDGSKTVDPTKDAVTSSVTYRALYNTGATHGVYMRGDSDGNFYPERNITRAEAAALIARLNANYNEGTKYSSSLTDVAAEEWYASAVNFCASSGLITGYDDGTFLPNNQITRQEFCAIVARYLSLNNAGEANFSDIDETIWGAGYISQLAGKGIINGYEDGTFAPNAPIKRCEVVKILNGVFDRTPDASTVNDNIGNYSVRIPDISANHWAYYEILEAAVEHDHADFHKAN